jgi:RHS repeat-associated protein
MTTEYTYDARGNVTEIEEIQDGQSSGIVVFEASYPGSCTNTLTCNQPTWAEDAAGNRTNYAYNSTHGGVTSVQPPDPDGGGSLPRPETRFAYDSFQAYYRTGSSTWGSGAAVYLVEEISACQTTASCDGAADENVTTFDYGPSASANNLLPVEVTTDEGDGGDAVTVAATYDHNGNALEIDGPLSGTADTTAYVYDVGRRVVGVIGPDPDGGGALVHRARRFTYNTQGRIELTEIGTTEGYTSTNWSNFSVLDESETEFDDYARAIESEGAPQAIIQTSYTADDQVECRAVRMNPAVYTSLPSSACTLSTEGTYGPDQITKYVYNDAGLIIQVRSAVGTSLEQVTQSYTYNAFGQVDTVTDANGNMTTYEFDGYHRPTKTRYPHPTSTGTSSTTDYEQLSYDAYGRVSSERRRDGTSFSFTYDNLGRVTDRDHSSVSTLDKTFTYDNFGQVTSTSQWWQTLTYEYDIHGRVTEEEHNYLGAVASQYDAAGRRTRVDYPGPNSFYVTYEYDVTGAMTKVRQQGSTVLATYAYDDLGRRVSLTRGNGAVTTYDYDAYQRLDELDHDLSGSTYDQTETFAYTPSGQLATRDATNDIYDASAPSGFSDDYDVDGLNQYTDIATLTPSYDSRGNMTSDGAASYTFDNDNRLVEAGSIDLTYDPLDRLYATNDSANTRFLFDGPHLASEKDNTGAVLRRYVYGASLDEPLVWYEGDDYSERYWFVSNRQGTIVAITNASGAVTNVNAYDDYGAPESALAGTFGLNGALWLSQTGLYHMRARAYDPRIGRFVSPDPIGYGDGMNMYAYVGNDPINRWDPMGLEMSGFPSLNNHEHCEYFMSQTACAYIWGEIDDPGYIGFTGSGRNNSICVSTPALCEPHSVQSLKQVISELNAALSQITQQTPPAALPENSGAFIGTTTGAEFGDIVSAMIAAAMTIVNFSDNGFYEYGVTFDVTQSGHIEVGVFQRGPRGGGRVRVSIGSSTVGWLHNHPSSGNAALDRVNREPSCCGRDTDVRETQRIMKHFDRSEFMVGIIGPDDVLRIWTYVWPESGQ